MTDNTLNTENSASADLSSCSSRKVLKVRKVRNVRAGNVTFGDGRIYVQSMLNTRPDDIEGSVRQAAELEKAGCEVVRIAIPDADAVRLVDALKNAVSMPVVADIHYDYRLALECVSAGVDKIRINPGNIGSMDRVRLVAKACREKQIPIRIGVNGGSLEKEVLAKYGKPTAEALAESAAAHIRLLNQCDFEDIVVSLKSSDVRTMIKAYRIIADRFSYPLHLGVTEAGTERMGIIKSAAGIGSLLCDGIGDTIRVSLTDDPVKEIYAAKDILKALGMGDGARIISCPTCGRTKIDLIGLAKSVEQALSGCDKNITVAVMGCAVNGIGEAGQADIGIAGGDGKAVIFSKGKMLRTVGEKDALNALLEEIEKL